MKNINKIFFLLYLYILTSTGMTRALSLDKTFNMYDIQFKYPKEMELGIDANKLQGRIYGYTLDHVFLTAWFKQPVEIDLTQLLENISPIIDQIRDKFPEVDIKSFTNSIQKNRYNEHEVSFIEFVGKYREIEGTGFLGSWYCKDSKRIFLFVLLSHEKSYSENLWSDYLSDYNCHSGEAIISSYPIPSIIIGLTISIMLLALKRNKYLKSFR